MKMSTTLYLFLFTISLLFLLQSVQGYKNYTVGDSLGWYDKLENPKVDYHNWAANKNFSLGDFLIFNTDNNHSVIQTYNFTTYKLCDYEDAQVNDTMEWAQSNPSSTSPHSISVAVPLVKVGMTYFFSSDYDGEQCQNGQQFKINVTYGHGLPPSMSDDSMAPISPQSGDDDTVPDTLVPSNFDNPRDVSDDTESEPSNSVSLVAFSNSFGVQLCGVVVLVGYFLVH